MSTAVYCAANFRNEEGRYAEAVRLLVEAGDKATVRHSKFEQTPVCGQRVTSHPHGNCRDKVNPLCVTIPLKAAELHSVPVRGSIPCT
jgi:hypothetical protein